MKRRTFLAAPLFIPARALGRGGVPAPGSRINLGVIGTGNQGFNDLKSFLRDDRVQVTAVCDVNRETPGYWEGGIAGREPAACWSSGTMPARSAPESQGLRPPTRTSANSSPAKTSTRS